MTSLMPPKFTFLEPGRPIADAATRERSGVIVVNTVDGPGHWVFEQLAREHCLTVVTDRPLEAVQRAVETGGLVGYNAPDPTHLIDAIAGQLAPVTVIVLTLHDEWEVPCTSHRWVALDRPGALKRLSAVLEQHLRSRGR